MLEPEPALRALHHDFVVLPEHPLDGHARGRMLHDWRPVMKIIKHGTRVGLHKHAGERVISAVDVIEMHERVCDEVIERLLVESRGEIAVDMRDLQCT